MIMEPKKFWLTFIIIAALIGGIWYLIVLLDGLPSLDTTEPGEFANLMDGVHRRFGIRILGGCCGTNARHIAAIAERVTRAR